MLVLMAALLCLVCMVALGEDTVVQAADITAECRVTTSGGKFKISRMWDRKYKTTWVSYKEKQPYVAFEAPGGQKIHGVYVCFGDALQPWALQTEQDGQWVTVYASDGEYAHEFAAVDGLDNVRIVNQAEKQNVLSLSEVYIFTDGQLPDFVQRWEPTLQKADLMVLVAHPDDEILFMGGTIPYYAGELKKDVLVTYMTCGTTERRSELLDGLWLAGVRHYPVIGPFYDQYSKKLEKGYEIWGKKKVDTYLVELLRTYRPEVVVTHDVEGEYGHGAHRVCADALKRCVLAAADGTQYPEAGAAWQTKKLYIHLYGENAVEMDWDQPLSAFDGKTGYEVAEDMYRCHVSQQDAGQKNRKTGKFEKFRVEPRDSDYSCYRFGLAFTAVGPDETGNDFLEHVELPAE